MNIVKAKRITNRILIFSGAGLLIWLFSIGLVIWRFGEQNFSRPSDCIIVLGAAVEGGHPSPVFEERINHALNLYREGVAPYIIFTGGVGEGQDYSESSVAEAYALVHGVPHTAILTENASRTTKQNINEAFKVMQGRGLNSAILVSDPLHLKRASVMAKNVGVEAVSSPTPTTRYRTWKTKLGFLVREIYFIQHD